MAKFFFLDLRDLIALYLLKPRYWLNHYTNLRGDFFDEIESSHTYFDHMRPMHQLSIVEIIAFHKIIRKEIVSGHETCNDRRHVI